MVQFPSKKAVAMFESHFKSLVNNKAATPDEKPDHWVLFKRDLYKTGVISEHQKSVWTNPYR